MFNFYKYFYIFIIVIVQCKHCTPSVQYSAVQPYHHSVHHKTSCTAPLQPHKLMTSYLIGPLQKPGTSFLVGAYFWLEVSILSSNPSQLALLRTSSLTPGSPSPGSGLLPSP